MAFNPSRRPLGRQFTLDQPPAINISGTVRRPNVGLPTLGRTRTAPGAPQSASRLTPQGAGAPPAGPRVVHGGGGGIGAGQVMRMEAGQRAQLAQQMAAAQVADQAVDPAVIHAKQLLALDALEAPARKIAAAMQTIGAKLAAGAYMKPGAPGENGQPGGPPVFDAVAMFGDALQSGLTPQQMAPLVPALELAMTARTREAAGALFAGLGKTVEEHPHDVLTPEQMLMGALGKVPSSLRSFVDPKNSQALEWAKTFSQGMLGNSLDELHRDMQTGTKDSATVKNTLEGLIAKGLGAALLDPKTADALRQQYGQPLPSNVGKAAQSFAQGATTAAGKGGPAYSSTPDGKVYKIDPTTQQPTLMATEGPDGSITMDPAFLAAEGHQGAFSQMIEAITQGIGQAAQVPFTGLPNAAPPSGGPPPSQGPQVPGLQGAPAPPALPTATDPMTGQPIDPNVAAALAQPPAPTAGVNTQDLLTTPTVSPLADTVRRGFGLPPSPSP